MACTLVVMRSCARLNRNCVWAMRLVLAVLNTLVLGLFARQGETNLASPFYSS